MARELTSNVGQLGKLKEFLFKYCLSDQTKTFRIMLHPAIHGKLCVKDSDLWHDPDPDLPRPDVCLILKMIQIGQNWYIPMRVDETSTEVGRFIFAS